MDAGDRLWRFMDFTKYVAMLDAGALYFTRSDRFSDPFEGALARGNPRPENGRGAPDEFRRRVLVSSWHRNDHESAAMWRIYLAGSDGVAIRTTAGALQRALAGRPEPIRVGAVRYLDYERDQVPEHGTLERFLCKRRSFEYEQEVRALWCADEPVAEEGHYLHVDLGRLLDAVVVSPSASSWFGRLVVSVTERYGLDLHVVTSELAEEPD